MAEAEDNNTLSIKKDWLRFHLYGQPQTGSKVTKIP